MLTNVRFNVLGEEQYVRGFELMAQEAADLSEPLEDAGEIIIQSVEEQFGSTGSHSGRPWAPLSAAYRKWKAIHYPGKPILERTGEMKRAMIDKQTALFVNKQTLIYEPQGENADIAAYHQGGSGHLPVRRMVDLTTSDRRAIDRAFVSWTNSLRRGAIR